MPASTPLPDRPAASRPTAEPASPAAHRAITARSVAVGFAGVAVICVVTPYNDFVMWNTFVVGNSLPMGGVVLAFTLCVVNALLSRWRPRSMFTSGELAVVTAMVLVGCAIPSSGLMRYLPASLVYPLSFAAGDGDFARLLSSLNLPPWLLPDMAGRTPAEWMYDPVVAGYVQRWPEGAGTPPYAAWIRPALAWAVFIGAFWAAMTCVLALVRRQWYENERLAFPIAEIQASLIEAPAPGRRFGPTLSSPLFWLMFWAILAFHSLNALHVYHPKYFPDLRATYDLRTVFADRPWSYTGGHIKQATVYFVAVGVAYLLAGSVSFSLWACVLGVAAWQMIQGTSTGDNALPGLPDQQYGGTLAYAAAVLWVGRKHWAVILRQAFRGERDGEPRGRYLPYAWAFWGLVASLLVMAGWLVAAGCTVGGAATLTLLILLAFFFVARVVAETGLIHPGEALSFVRPWQLTAYYGGTPPVPQTTFHLGSHLYLIFHDARESFGVFASHAMKVTDRAVFDDRPLERARAADRATGRKLILLFACVLAVGYALSFGSMVYNEYAYAAERHVENPLPVNRYIGEYATKGKLIDPSLAYSRGSYNFAHDPATHLAAGAAVTTALSALRLTFAWWPLHPIGYLFMNTWPMQQLWFSILIGWLARTIALRFGGARLYTQLRRGMIGMIVGEAVASAAWLLIAVALDAAGYAYHPIRFTLY
jgi:hypothetical protein